MQLTNLMPKTDDTWHSTEALAAYAYIKVRALTCLHCNNSISSYSNDVICTYITREFFCQTEHTNFTITMKKL